MRRSKLAEHTFKKGKFLTPINSIPMMKEFEDEKSWTYGRMPEYLWIGMIFKHFGREEVFYIIAGNATLKTPKGDIAVTEGDVIVIPPNENGAHMLTNTSNTPVSYLDIDTQASPDVILYPDAGNIRIMAGSMQKSFKFDSEVNYLDGE